MTKAEDIGQIVRECLRDAVHERGRVNVLIAGRTGVGKSTLINAIFDGNLAKTGQGRPVTSTTREYTKEGIPLAIWDTRGLEMADFEATTSDLDRLIRDRASDPDLQRRIHVAWLCILEDGRRVEDAEIDLHRLLSRHMPVLGVITKARSDSEFRAEMQRLLPEARNVVRVHAVAERLDGGTCLPPFGLRELVDLTAEVLSEESRGAFAASQMVSIELKKAQSHKIVAGAADSAPFRTLIPAQSFH